MAILRGRSVPSSEALLSKLGLFSKWRIPLLASPRGGVAERSRKYCAAYAFCEDGVVFRSMGQGTPPGGVHKEASHHFLGDAATPPRGDARRGIRSFQNETPNHIVLSRPLWTRLSTTSATLAWKGLFSKWRIPLLASPRGGVAERSRKYCAASAFREDGVVFRSMGQGTPPRRRP